jgi:hypothetical protein
VPPADATFRRRLALVALAEARLREGFLGRAASVYGWGIALSYSALVLIARGAARALVVRAFDTACLVVGALVALALLREGLRPHALDTVALLARENGFGRADVRLARGVGALLRFGKAVAVPCALLAVVALSVSLVGAEP